MTSLKVQRHIIIARDVRPPKPPLGILSCPISWDLFSKEKFQAIFQLQSLQPVSYPVNTPKASNLM